MNTQHTFNLNRPDFQQIISTTRLKPKLNKTTNTETITIELKETTITFTHQLPRRDEPQ